MRIRCSGNPILKIDLTSNRITKEQVAEDTTSRFIAGRGLGDWLLWKHVDPGKTDPMGPGNVLVFTSGLLLGTSYPGAVRNSVVFLNTLTRGYGESSSAGHFAFRLKQAGYDGLVISGRASRPSYIYISDDHVEIRPASEMTGMTTFDTDRAVKEALRVDDLSTCTIGPAGENLVRYAAVNCDNRYLGRCGIGAVMGSKNLKAIAVHGSGSVEAADESRLGEMESAVREACKQDPVVRQWAETGSLKNGASGYNERGMLPVRNFQEADFEGASRTGYEYVKPFCKSVIQCPTRCPIVCDRNIEIGDGYPYSGTKVSSMQATPAYNTTKLLIEDIPTTIKIFEMCNAYGVDIHAWTCVLGWAIECFERGILTRDDTDGLELRWGDGPLAIESIGRIAKREGRLGNLLAEGVAVAAKRLGRGAEQYAMHIRGMELDDELRVSKAEALGILVESRGPGHVLATPGGGVRLSPEMARQQLGTEAAADPLVYEGKPELIVMAERGKAIMDCLGLCLFSYNVQDHLDQHLVPDSPGGNRLGAYAELIRAATGRDISEEELVAVADRILTVERSINVLGGIERQDELPPDRFYEPIPAGRSKGMALDRDKTLDMLRRHSALHGWDPETGIPTQNALHALGLSEIADRFKRDQVEK